MDFVAIDVETANRKRSSICQIGLAVYKDSCLAEEWVTYVNPHEIFEWFNTKIHGINQSTVQEAPDIKKVSPKLYKYLENQIVVSHTGFDYTAICQAFDKHQLRHPKCAWLDSHQVARSTWERMAVGSYKLSAICSYLGYSFNHHDALEDAKAAGHIMLCAIKETGLDLNDWLRRCCI